MSGAILTLVTTAAAWVVGQPTDRATAFFHDVSRACWPASCEVMRCMAQANCLGAYGRETKHGPARPPETPNGNSDESRAQTHNPK